MSVHVRTPPSGLLSFPTELKTEIIKWLPWEDFMKQRTKPLFANDLHPETGKIFFEDTKLWDICAPPVEDHISLELISPQLERPFEKYSPSELDGLFLRWKGTKIGWKTDDGRPAREQSFYADGALCAHLVKGGWWFLTTVPKTGSVTYYDLDAETISGVELISPQAECCDVRDLLVALEVDTESPDRRFTMAFSLFDRVSEGVLSSSIRLVVSGGLAIFSTILDVPLGCRQPRSLKSHIFSLSLRGPDIALNGWDTEEPFIVVMEWDLLIQCCES